MIIALVYLDKVSQVLKVYSTSGTIRRLFSSCLLISTKLHSSDIEELSRERICEMFQLDVHELLESESILMQEIQDLNIHPQQLMGYIKPILLGNT